MQGRRRGIVLAGFLRRLRRRGDIRCSGGNGRRRPRRRSSTCGNTVIAMRHNRRKIAVSVFVKQHGTAWSAVFGHGIIHLFNDHAIKRLIGSENTFELFDTTFQIITLRFQFDAAHLGQTAQSQIEDVLRLNLVQIEYGDELRLRGFGVVGRTDHLNDLVDVDHGQQQTLHQMQALQRLLPAELAASANHHTTMIHPYLKHLLEAHGMRAAVDQRHIVDGEIILQRRVLEQLDQHGVRIEPGLDLNDQSSAVMSIGQIDGAGDTFQLAVLHTFGNTFQHTFRAHHERKLRHYDRLLASRHILDMRHGTRGQRATTRLVRLADALTAHNHAAARPIRTRHVAHQLL